MARKTRAIAILALMATSAAGCSLSSSSVPEPKGIGSDNNELKGSPCACIEIEMQMPHGARTPTEDEAHG